LLHYKKYGYLGVLVVSSLSPSAIPISFVAGTIHKNIWLVGFLSALGSTTSTVLSYNIGNAGELLINDDNYWFKLIKEYIHKYGSLAIFVLALLPNLFFDFAGMFGGVAKYGLWRLLPPLYIGKYIKYTLAAYVGSRLYKNKKEK
jgi:membrane protein YqaA with SNARE-associated domain